MKYEFMIRHIEPHTYVLYYRESGEDEWQSTNYNTYYTLLGARIYRSYLRHQLKNKAKNKFGFEPYVVEITN